MVRLVNKPCSQPIKDGASKAFKTFIDKVMGCLIELLVPLVMKRELKNPNHLNQLSKLLEGLQVL